MGANNESHLTESSVEREGNNNDTLRGSDDHDAFHSGIGDDSLDGGNGDDLLDGGEGDDDLTGGNGNNTILGGSGTDTAVYTGIRNATDIRDNHDGTYTVTHGEFEDTLSAVERVHFNDGTMSVSHAIELHDKQAEVSRFYKALFERDPDEVGLAFWVNATVESTSGGGGITIQNVAQEFSKSTEFQNKYGPSVSNAEFVHLLYQNILHREADQSGYDYWLNIINETDDRGVMIVGFSDSVEYVAETATTVDAFLATVALNNYVLV